MYFSTIKKQCISAKGFTMVELLIVMGIIAVLATGLVIALNPQGQIQRANDAKRKSDLVQIQKALEQYYNDNGKYPNGTGATGVASTRFRIIDASGATIDWGTTWSTYMQTVPKDPTSTTKQYVYKVNGNNQTYWLYASLDNLQDPQLCNSGGAVCTNAPSSATACGGICNYGVSSSNSTP